jgi:hypothetical protein
MRKSHAGLPFEIFNFHVFFSYIRLSALFILATVVFAWGEGRWKYLQLAILFHGLSENNSQPVRNLREYANIRELVKGIQVRLEETEM